jgi:hypothetical protein
MTVSDLVSAIDPEQRVEAAKIKSPADVGLCTHTSFWKPDVVRRRKMAGGGMGSNHRLVLFTHALYRLSYPPSFRGYAPAVYDR